MSAGGKSAVASTLASLASLITGLSGSAPGSPAKLLVAPVVNFGDELASALL